MDISNPSGPKGMSQHISAQQESFAENASELQSTETSQTPELTLKLSLSTGSTGFNKRKAEFIEEEAMPTPVSPESLETEQSQTSGGGENKATRSCDKCAQRVIISNFGS
jgi:hypothetical protein